MTKIILAERPQQPGQPRTTSHFTVSVEGKSGAYTLLKGMIRVEHGQEGFKPVEGFPGVPAHMEADFQAALNVRRASIAKRFEYA